MSDGKKTHAGILRASMQAIKEALETDSTLIENGVNVCYTLDHPSKQIVGAVPKFRLKIEPAGFSQTTSAGVLDLQYYTWITIKYKPATHGVDEEDELSYICEYLTDLLHKKMWGGMSTYISKVLINYTTCKLTSNHREVELELAKDEIGAIICMWQSPKSIEEIGNGTDVSADID